MKTRKEKNNGSRGDESSSQVTGGRGGGKARNVGADVSAAADTAGPFAIGGRPTGGGGATVKIRDRVIELRRVRAGDLLPNPRNWRRHSDAQADAMRGVLAEVGFAGAELVRETPDGLMLIDGHLRAELDPDAELPCLVLDVDEAEAALLLATYDPLGAMAEADPGALGTLLADVATESKSVQAMLDNLAADNGIFGAAANDPNAEWEGMPAFENEKTDEIRLVVYFLDAENRSKFGRMLGCSLTDDTKYIWFPQGSKPPRQSVKTLVVESDGS